MLSVEVLDPHQWQRWKVTRLRALADAPDAFWATYADEERFDEQRWRRWLDRDDASVFVVVRAGQDVGCAIGAAHHAIPNLAGLYSMWVAPEARGIGAGDALIEAVVDWARTRRFGVLRFDVADDNAAAIALYARHGAVATGDRAVFPPPRDHITEHELEIAL